MSIRLPHGLAHPSVRTQQGASLLLALSLALTSLVPCLSAAQSKADFPQPLSPWKQLEQTQRELLQADSQLQQHQRELSLRESEQAKLVAQIEQLKSQPFGPVRDLRLDALLAQAKDRADELSQRSLVGQRLSAQRVSQQKKLLQVTDRLLAGEAGLLESGKRVWLLRLRAELSERLYADEPERLKALAQSSVTLEKSAAQLDDPQGLRDRADLLRDSADKLMREMQRLKERREALLKRQRVRQRAVSVDEDLFAEQATARRGNSAAFGSRGESKLADAAAPTVGGGPMAPTPTTSPDPNRDSGALRTAIDPSTLDALLRSDSSVDANAQAGALERAESELGALAQQLQRRAAQLEQQAQGLHGKK